MKICPKYFCQVQMKRTINWFTLILCFLFPPLGLLFVMISGLTSLKGICLKCKTEMQSE
jgi:hypothetical protein